MAKNSFLADATFENVTKMGIIRESVNNERCTIFKLEHCIDTIVSTPYVHIIRSC